MLKSRKVVPVVKMLIKCLEVEEGFDPLFRASREDYNLIDQGASEIALIDGSELEDHKENIKDFRVFLLNSLTHYLQDK